MANELYNVNQLLKLYKELNKKYQKLKKEQNKALKIKAQKKKLANIRSKIAYQKRKQKLLTERAQVGATVLRVNLRKKHEDFKVNVIGGNLNFKLTYNNKKLKLYNQYINNLQQSYLSETLARLKDRLDRIAKSLALETTEPEELAQKVAEWTVEMEELKTYLMKTRSSYYQHLFSESIKIYEQKIGEVKSFPNFPTSG